MTDALVIARRHIDKVFAFQNQHLVLLALDWAKAFDSIIPEPMLIALQLFGLPEQFIHMTRAIYTSREFYARANAMDSSKKVQHAGISQGCPLSPILFVIMMTALIIDTRTNLARSIGNEISNVSEILFADDNWIVNENCDMAEQYMYCIRAAGSKYGLDFNWDKLEYISFNCNPNICKPDGTSIKHVQSMTYIGGLLANDGRVASELGRSCLLYTSPSPRDRG